MKRIIGIVCLLVLMVTMLTACNKFTCADCGQVVKGKEYVLDVAGEEFSLCNDCYNEYQERRAEVDRIVKDGIGDLTQI